VPTVLYVAYELHTYMRDGYRRGTVIALPYIRARASRPATAIHLAND